MKLEYNSNQVLMIILNKFPGHVIEVKGHWSMNLGMVKDFGNVIT